MVGPDLESEAPRGPPLASAPTYASLESLLRLIEQEAPGMRASVLLLDRRRGTLRHAAAPSLPMEFCRQIDGSPVGPEEGSCGTAAWRGEQVIVSDIASDPLWDRYRHLALPHGLRACWSTPIEGAAGEVLGTFAMYYPEPREPTPRELELTRTVTMLAQAIILRAREERALRRSRRRTHAARREAERANRAKASFLAMMSHELRTPLNAIGGYADLLLDGIPEPLTEGQRSYLLRIRRAQQHLLRLIEAVLTHAKLEVGRMTYSIQPVVLGGLLDDLESLCSPLIQERGLEYRCDACDRRLLLACDPQRTLQILLNLVSNAVKFTAPGGAITLSTAAPSPELALVSVRDTGVGMTPEQTAAVFEPYVQFENPLSQEESGVGLGMPISRALARGMRGDLTVESAPGAGTTFTLALPRLTGAPPSAAIG